MSLEDMFGDLHTIDILAESKNNEILMVLVCNGYVAGEPEIQTALLDKMEEYLNYTYSEEFKEKYAGWPITLQVKFTEAPHQIILELLSKCVDWADDYGVVLEIELNGNTVRL